MGSIPRSSWRNLPRLSLEMRRRNEGTAQKLGGHGVLRCEFLLHRQNETFEEHYVSVPEQGGGKLIPVGAVQPGQVYRVPGQVRHDRRVPPGVPDAPPEAGNSSAPGWGRTGNPRRASNTAFVFPQGQWQPSSGSISTVTRDYIVIHQDLQGIDAVKSLALPTLVATCSVALRKPAINSMAVLGKSHQRHPDQGG